MQALKYTKRITHQLTVLLFTFVVMPANSIGNRSVIPSITNSEIVDGIFSINKISVENFRQQNLFTKYQVSVHFPSDSMGLNSLNGRRNAGTVKLNNYQIDYFNSLQFYIDTTINLSNALGYNWNIQGSTQIGGFNFLNSNKIPNFNPGLSNLPIAIDTSSDLHIQLNQITNADSVFISFSRTDSVETGPFVTQNYSASNGSFVIEKKQFSKFTSGQNLYLQVEISNYKNKVVAGKNYWFINSFDYKKKIIVR